MTRITPKGYPHDRNIPEYRLPPRQGACALYKEQFDSCDLIPQQFGLLRFLWEEDGITQVELSSRSQIDRTTIGGLIDRLELSGLPQRLHHPDDRRAYRICLTESRRKLEVKLLPLERN